ncbi:hypothetical protein [Variovorax sp. OV700]
MAAQKAGFFESEITPVNIPQKKGEAIVRRSLPSAAQRRHWWGEAQAHWI